MMAVNMRLLALLFAGMTKLYALPHGSPLAQFRSQVKLSLNPYLMNQIQAAKTRLTTTPAMNLVTMQVLLVVDRECQNRTWPLPWKRV